MYRNEMEAVRDWFEVEQENVAAWAARNFPDDDTLTIVSAAAEEANEILRAARKQRQQIRGTREEWDAEIRKETADTFITLLQIAGRLNFDLLEEYQTRWAEVRQRDFRADPVGHGLPKEDGS